MISKVSLAFFICLITSGFTYCQLTDKKELATKIDAYINPLVQKNDFSGTILIACGDSILFVKGYGYANRELGVCNTPNTVYLIGSMTKQFTATAIMQLVDQKKISVESTLSEFIPDYPKGNLITIHRLLTHTGGIPDYTKLPNFAETSKLPATITNLIEKIKFLPLDFEPGAEFRYTNSGYLLLTYIIEKVTGLTYEAYITENIFKPLHMTETGCGSNTKLIQNMAFGYSRNQETNSIEHAAYLDLSIPQGAGVLYSSVLDLYKWDRSFYKDSILTKTGKEKMFTFSKADYGYGWGKEVRKGGRISIGHNGVINGFSSIIHRFPADDCVIIILANIDTFSVNEVFNTIPAIFFEE